MPLQPKRTKYRKPHLGWLKGKATKGTTLAFGEFGLRSLETGWLSARALEAARVAISRYLQKGGKIYLRVFPDHVVTKKPAETRMGGGKGSPEEWVAPVKRGRIILEVGGVDRDIAVEALRIASYKLPFKVKIVEKEKEEAEEVVQK
ncbi:50S ribosomal protein L16 [bacterium]|nr:50S ribosomal protein L16 [bacterium]